MKYSKATVFGLVLAAFAVRLALMLALETYTFERMDDRCRVGEITSVAIGIVHHYGFSSPFMSVKPDYTGPTALVPPTYPYLIAGIFKLYGENTSASVALLFELQALMSALTVIPILGIASYSMGGNAGLIAGWIWAVFPWFAKWALTYEWETALSALLMTTLIWYALKLDATSSIGKWAKQGLLQGFVVLTNPALASVIPVSMVWHAGKLRRRDWFKPLLSVAICCVMITPWVIRNRMVFHKWIFLRDGFGLDLALGNYHNSNGRGWTGHHPTGNLYEYDSYKRMGEITYMQDKQSKAVAFIKQYPSEFAALIAARVVFFWDGSGMIYRDPVAWYWIPKSFLIFSMLALFSLLVARRARMYGWQIYVAVIALYPMPYYLTHVGEVRYRHPVEPLMLLLVVYAASEWSSLLSQPLFAHPAPGSP